jgi:hypothetical protein
MIQQDFLLDPIFNEDNPIYEQKRCQDTLGCKIDTKLVKHVEQPIEKILHKLFGYKPIKFLQEKKNPTNAP